MNRWMRHREAKLDNAETRARPLHHSPWFWLGVVLFMLAILTYVFSEDLSLRPRLHGAAQPAYSRPLAAP